MALKDWKKNTLTGDVPAWVTKQRPFLHIWITKSINNKGKKIYEVRSDFSQPILKVFKTKAEALKYAKEYMKKH